MNLPSLQGVHVLVVGDVMLDRYWSGPARRVSQEAPVPVVNIEQVDERPGGAANVALNVASLDFGDVDADGTDYSTVSVTAQGRNGADTGGTYVNDASSVTFECKAAPSSTAVIALNSTAADHTVGSMDDDGLEVRVPDTNGGTSTGYQVFTSAANLITGMAVGNGTNRASGDVDMRLTVLDVDPFGANTWVVRLRATGNP